MKELTGVDDVAPIVDDGSPQGSRLFVLWNPPLHQPQGTGEPPRSEKPELRKHEKRQNHQCDQVADHVHA